MTVICDAGYAAMGCFMIAPDFIQAPRQ